MKKIEIEYIDINSIKPYENNPRINDDAVEYVANSIREFGFKVPVVVDKNNVIVTGHTRIKAAETLGIKKIPCIRANDLTKDQVKAFRLADNKVSEVATWDFEKLELELADIELDMSAFDFSVGVDHIEFEEDNNDGYYGDERERTNKAYNLDLVPEIEFTDDFWQMPIIKNDKYIPEELIGFNYAKTSKNKDCGIHFYVDDYQFERIWNAPEDYLDLLMEYDCILTPDFSLYMDMPMPMKIWNIYRSRFIGAYYQSKGITVIPSISWAEENTFNFCFSGIEKGSVVSISTIGVKRDPKALKIWRAGVDEMIKQIKPSVILIYGSKIEHDFGKIKTIYFENKVTENWKSNKSEV